MHKPATTNNRVSRIQDRLSQFQTAGVLFFDMANIRYLVGFSGSDGALFIGEKQNVLLVDGRYVTQAKRETAGCEIVEYRDKTDGLVRLMAEYQNGTVGFESTALTCDKYFTLQERLRDVTLKPLSTDLNSIRAIKDREEITFIKEAAHIASQAFMSAMARVTPGACEKDIASFLESEMKHAGAESLSFDTIVASGHNSALPHAKPGSRLIEHGDLIVIDFGAVYLGYHSDETCTIVIGSPTDEQKKMYAVVKEAHDKALHAVKEGVPCKEIDRIARQKIEEAGYGYYFSHGTGHGVGLEVHEAPTISSKSNDYLEAGMIITIEPGIYIPDLGGVRIEDLIMVERDGCQVLSEVPKELRVIDWHYH